ncbi:MAG TPA: hypothetical protein VF189_02170 [Patescibacteria group bacterium]
MTLEAKQPRLSRQDRLTNGLMTLRLLGATHDQMVHYVRDFDSLGGDPKKALEPVDHSQQPKMVRVRREYPAMELEGMNFPAWTYEGYELDGERPRELGKTNVASTFPKETTEGLW